MDTKPDKASLQLNEYGEIEVPIKRSSVDAMRAFAEKTSPDMLAIEGQEMLQRHLKVHEAIWAREQLKSMGRDQLVAEIEHLRAQFKFCVEIYNVCFIAWSLEKIDGPKIYGNQLARKAAKAKNKNDPRQAAKLEAFKLWQHWQSGKTLHKSGAAFARFVCDQYSAIESPTTVERWVRKWVAEKAKIAP